MSKQTDASRVMDNQERLTALFGARCQACDHLRGQHGGPGCECLFGYGNFTLGGDGSVERVPCRCTRFVGEGATP